MKKNNLNHIQRQLLKWAKLWMGEKDPQKKAFYLKNLLKINVFVYNERQRD